MAVFKRKNSPYYQYDFIIAGKRIQESARTKSKTLAVEAERRRRRELEHALAGVPIENRANRIQSVADVVSVYLETYAVNHRRASVSFSKACLAHVRRLLGSKLLSDLTEQAIRNYMKARTTEGVSGRTINAELGELSRAIGKPWKTLWPRVRKMEERKDVGKALSAEEEGVLLKALGKSKSIILPTFVRAALLTAMRSGEILSLTWGQVDFAKRLITVGRAKTSSGTGRQIPMNVELFSILATHAEWFTQRFGEATASSYVFPYGSPTPCDPTRPTTTIKTAWNTLKRQSGVQCRIHDLRHTAITKLAEGGVSESTLLSLAGHMSRAMLERYSHIRLATKRDAMNTLTNASFSDVVPANSPALTIPAKLV